MALTFFWRCESETFDGTHDFVAPGGDSTPTAVSGPAINGTAALVGSNGIQIAAAGATYQFDTTTAVFDRLVGAVGFLLRPITLVTDAQIIQIRGTTIADQYFLRMAGADELIFGVGDPDLAVGAVTTTVDLATSTIYGVIGRWDHGNSLLRIEVYSTPLTTPTLIQGVTHSSGYTAPTGLVDTNRFRMGDVGGLGMAMHLDNIFVADAYAEPIEDNFAIASYTDYGAEPPENIHPVTACYPV